MASGTTEDILIDYPNYNVYETWIGSISQSGTDNPTISSTLNELEVNFTGTRISKGIYRVEADTNFMLNDNLVVSYNCSTFANRDYLFIKYVDSKTFEIQSTIVGDEFDDGFNFDIEIKVYPFRNIVEHTTTEIKINN